MPVGRALKVVVAVGAGVAALAAATRAYDRYETPERAYPTRAAAERAGEGRRGWLPAFVPAAATDVRIAGDLDTGRAWLRFALPPGAWRGLVAGLEPLSLTQVWQADPGAPGWLGWWHPDLRPEWFVPPSSGAPVAAFRAPEPGRCLAVDTTGGVGYVWSCPPGA